MSSFKVSFELSKELFHPTRVGWCWQGRENTNIQFVPSDKTRIRRVNETQCIAVLSIFWLPPRHKKPKYPHLQRQPSSTARPTLHQTNQGLHLLYTVLHLHHFRFAHWIFVLLTQMQSKDAKSDLGAKPEHCCRKQLLWMRSAATWSRFMMDPQIDPTATLNGSKECLRRLKTIWK